MSQRHRCSQVAEAIEQSKAQSGHQVIRVSTAMGDVVIRTATVEVDAVGVSWVDVRVDHPSGGDPHYRIFNPPLLVEDPAGDVLVAGRRFRRDPVAAIAETIARHGGSSSGRRGKR